MVLEDFHGWTEDKAYVVGDNNGAEVEFDNGDKMVFDSYHAACDWLWERGYR